MDGTFSEVVRALCGLARDSGLMLADSVQRVRCFCYIEGKFTSKLWGYASTRTLLRV